MNTEELIKHRKALEEREKDFDKDRNLILSGMVGKYAYHTKLAGKQVHGTRDSLSYAVGLLYGDNEEYTKRAIKIIEQILKLQDTNPESKTFGLWSYYAEESLEEMDAPDWNWADFLGKQIVEILYIHKDKIPERLIEPLGDACRYACESVITRNEGVQYTNIAFMESLLLISTGELLGVDRYLEYGLDQLERFLGFYKFQGGVFEYNSPCYTPLITRDVGTFLKLVKNEEARKNAEKVNDLCWKMIAEHFRADLLQLAGPHSRAYSDYVADDFIYSIELACEGEISFDCEKKYDCETFWTKPFCPEKYRKYFKGEKLPESTEKLIIKGFNYPFFAFSQTATTYHEEMFTLGTFNREELWNQRRPLLGYIKGKTKPYCVRVRCLHDGYDFSSAALHCVQEKSSVLGIVNFSSNRGDTHIGLDKASDAVYETLELSFEVEGDTDGITYERGGNSAIINAGGVNIDINIPDVKFGENNIEYKIRKEENKVIYSIILYSGEKTKIDLPALDAAYVCFTLSLNSEVSEVTVCEDERFVNIAGESFGRKLEVKSLKAVHPFMNIMYEDLQMKDGERLEDIS